MPSRTDELLRYLEDQHEILRRAVDMVPPDQRELKPSPDRRSVAEILEHIALVEARLQKLFASKVAEARASGLGPEEASLPDLHQFDATRVLDRSRAVAAGEAVRPTGRIDAMAAWGAVERSFATFREAVRASDGVPLGRFVHPHPVFGPMTLYGWVEFVGGHEARHAGQIAEIATRGVPA
jgi:DinB family protein